MEDAGNQPDRWVAMVRAVERARDRPTEVMAVVSTCGDRPDAVAALASVLEIPADLADQLLDLRLSEFLGRSST